MSIQAPKGGIVSPVNGEFYAGGEFLPDTGKYCGRGRNAATASRFAEVARQAISNGYELDFDPRSEEYRLSVRRLELCNGCNGELGGNHPCFSCNDSGFSDSSVQVVISAKSIDTIASVLDRVDRRENRKNS